MASLTSRLPARLSPLFALLLSARALGAAAAWQVNVNVDLTDAGRKVAHPSPEHPVYYYPVVGGYRELGTAIAGEKPPPALPVVQHLARALARQGYLVSRRVSAAGGDGGILSLVPAPSLILVLHWGCMNPVAIDLTTDSNLPNVAVANESQELALVAGNSLNDLDLNFEKEAVMQGIQQNRYFVTVVANDFAAYYRKHRKVMLWAAKMSMPSGGVEVASALPALIASGGPLFGRETRRPQWILLPAGHVEVGEPRLMDYHDAAPPPPAAAHP